MSDSFFTSSPHWGLSVLLYFFVGGIAGGCLFLAGLLHLFGTAADRPTVRMGRYFALAGAVLSALLLTLDLTRPLRFWHMLIQSHSGRPILKPWSPMSLGAWGLLTLGSLAFLTTLAALAESRPARWGRFAALGRGFPGAVLATAGALAGLFIAGYTGILLSVTNRPIWADSTWLGVLFLLSGVSCAGAALFLLASRSQPRVEAHWLLEFDRRILVLELVALGIFLWSLGEVARSWIGWNGVLLVLGVAGAGIVIPLRLTGTPGDRAAAAGSREPGASGTHFPASAPIAACLVLLGGFLLRLLVIASSARIQASGSGVAGP
jgi:formate-dependent nitrite reductase membrane component NrfD